MNLLLTIVTLGIYSAWAKVRRLRYFYGNTRLDQTAFEYHGRPIQILKGRLIASGAYAIFYVAAQIKPWTAIAFFPLFMFGVPWIIMKSRRFQMHVTSYRGLRLGFSGTYGEALRAYVGWPLLGALTLGILFPRSIWEQVNYLLSKSHYGTEQARFTTARSVFYRFYYIATGLGIGLSLATIGIFVATARAEDSGGDRLPDALMTTTGILFALFSVVLVLVGLLVAAYYQKSYLNASFNGLALGPHRVTSSLETGPLFVLYLTNFGADRADARALFALGEGAPDAIPARESAGRRAGRPRPVRRGRQRGRRRDRRGGRRLLRPRLRVVAEAGLIAGLFYDGERSRGHRARLELGASRTVQLTLEDELGADGRPRRFELPLAEVEISDRLGSIPRRLVLPGIGFFETPDNEAVDRALAALGHSPGVVHWLEQRWPVAIAALVAVALGSALFIRFGVPALADFAAQKLPTSVDRVLGAQTLEILDRVALEPSTLPGGPAAAASNAFRRDDALRSRAVTNTASRIAPPRRSDRTRWRCLRASSS